MDNKTADTLLKQIQTIKLDNISNQKKEQKLNALYDKYEQGLTYCGSSAIEDKL